MSNFFNALLAGGGTMQQQPVAPLVDFIPVIFEFSQSNGGQGEAARLSLSTQIRKAGITKRVYTATPADCRIWFKPTMNMSNDGAMADIEAGVNTSQYCPSQPTFGAEISLCPLLKARTNEKVYYIKAMKGGTQLYPQVGDDWSASSVDDLLDQALNSYAAPAIAQILIENPGKTIKTVLLRHQGESDNTTTKRDAYATETTALLSKIRNFEIGGVRYFEDSPFIDTLLYYQPAQAQETLMNAVKVQYAVDNANCYTIDISSQPRKMDLTLAQKGGISPSMIDNEHSSYLAQLHKGEQAYDKLRAIDWI